MADWVLGITYWGYSLHSTAHNLLCRDPSLERVRGNLGRLLNQPIEPLAARAGSAAVASQRELVQVIVSLEVRDRTLRCAQPPTLQERGHPVNPRPQMLAHERRLPHHRRSITLSLPTDLPTPTVGQDLTARLDDLNPCGGQHRCRGVRDPSPPEAPALRSVRRRRPGRSPPR